MADAPPMQGQGSYYLPKNLSYFSNRLVNFSRQKVRISNTIGANQVFGPNEVININLPDNCLVDLSTLVLRFRASTAGGAGAAAARLPRHIETLIDSIYVSINGVAIQPSFTQYGQLFKIYADFQGLHDKATIRQVLNNSAATAPAGTDFDTNRECAIYNWLGFLGTAQPNVLDTSICGQTSISIRLAPATVVPTIGATAGTYSLNSVVAHMDVLSLDDGVLYGLVQQRLASGNPIMIPFTNIQTVVSSAGTLPRSVNWSVATQSLDSIVATLFPTTNTTQWQANIETAGTFIRGAAGLTNSRFTISGISYPSWEQDRVDSFLDTLQALGVAQDTLGATDPGLNSLDRYRDLYYAHVHNWNFQDDKENRLSSGINTMGQALQGTWEVGGATTNVVPVMWLLYTSMLKISAGKVVELVL